MLKLLGVVVGMLWMSFMIVFLFAAGAQGLQTFLKRPPIPTTPAESARQSGCWWLLYIAALVSLFLLGRFARVVVLP